MSLAFKTTVSSGFDGVTSTSGAGSSACCSWLLDAKVWPSFSTFALAEVQTRRPSFSTGISDPADFSGSVFTSLHYCLLLRLYLFLASANLSMFSWVLFSFIVLNRWRFLAEGGSGAMIKRTAGVWEATSPQRIGPVSSDGTWWLRTSV